MFHILIWGGLETPKPPVATGQVSGTYGSRATSGSFGDSIWLAWYFLDTIVSNETSP